MERRATTTLDWMVEYKISLLAVAADHLTLVRVGPVPAILTHPLPRPTLDLPRVANAVNGICNGGAMNHVAQALLTAPCYQFVRGEPGQAIQWLHESQQLPECSPMPIYLADILLHRARLLGGVTFAASREKAPEYRWPDPSRQIDLAEARKVIE